MTAPSIAADAFRSKLSPRARLLCPRGQDVDALIWAALERFTPQQLANIVGGVDHGLILTTERMRQRLRHAAGYDNDETGDR